MQLSSKDALLRDCMCTDKPNRLVSLPFPIPKLLSCLSVGKHWLGSQVDVTKQSAISKEHCLVPHKELLPILEPVGFTHSSQLYSLHLPGCELWPPTFWLRKTDWGSLWSLAVLFLSFTNRCGQFSLPGEGYAATPAGLGVKNQELKTYLGASLWHSELPQSCSAYLSWLEAQALS